MNMQPYLRNNDPNSVSEMFWDSLANGYGGVYTECRCGTQHYAVESRYLSSDEECGETIPPETTEGDFKVKHHHNCDSIAHYDFIGQNFVYGCDGCSAYLKRYEDFIWQERNTIRNYLKTRIDQEKKWSDYEHMCNVIAGISS